MRPTTLLLAAALFAAPIDAIAQNVVDSPAAADTHRDVDDDGNPRLGLLGLLGLGGLLGLLRREPDIHVDARRAKKS
jgi:MYXO-CTERM domain-containing protein